MDPNAALRNLLLACHPSACTDPTARDDMLDAISALDDWLDRGGFMPDAQAVISKLIADGYFTP